MRNCTPGELQLELFQNCIVLLHELLLDELLLDELLLDGIFPGQLVFDQLRGLPGTLGVLAEQSLHGCIKFTWLARDAPTWQGHAGLQKTLLLWQSRAHSGWAKIHCELPLHIYTAISGTSRKTSPGVPEVPRLNLTLKTPGKQISGTVEGQA